GEISNGAILNFRREPKWDQSGCALRGSRRSRDLGTSSRRCARGRWRSAPGQRAAWLTLAARSRNGSLGGVRIVPFFRVASPSSQSTTPRLRFALRPRADIVEWVFSTPVRRSGNDYRPARPKGNRG